jgi:hypothetical protein
VSIETSFYLVGIAMLIGVAILAVGARSLGRTV